jgi:hypothetical protein
VRLSPLGTAATSGLLYQPQMIDDGDCGEIGGLKMGRGNRSTRRKPALAPLCPPQIPHDQTRARTRAAAVRSQRLTAWAMARPHVSLSADPKIVSLGYLWLEFGFKNYIFMRLCDITLAVDKVLLNKPRKNALESLTVYFSTQLFTACMFCNPFHELKRLCKKFHCKVT